MLRRVGEDLVNGHSRAGQDGRCLLKTGDGTRVEQELGQPLECHADGVAVVADGASFLDLGCGVGNESHDQVRVDR